MPWSILGAAPWGVTVCLISAWENHRVQKSVGGGIRDFINAEIVHTIMKTSKQWSFQCCPKMVALYNLWNAVPSWLLKAQTKCNYTSLITAHMQRIVMFCRTQSVPSVHWKTLDILVCTLLQNAGTLRLFAVFELTPWLTGDWAFKTSAWRFDSPAGNLDLSSSGFFPWLWFGWSCNLPLFCFSFFTFICSLYAV